ncbi:MAG: hypothetical protein RKR03_17940 [Candidatus Competibacter sp.]|nr:hypothetical protein [Candidatus Competibacter sp.]
MTPAIIIRLVGRSMRNQAVSIPDMRSLSFFFGMKKSRIIYGTADRELAQGIASIPGRFTPTHSREANYLVALPNWPLG